jgi:hypothetical protein
MPQVYSRITCASRVLNTSDAANSNFPRKVQRSSGRVSSSPMQSRSRDFGISPGVKYESENGAGGGLV